MPLKPLPLSAFEKLGIGIRRPEDVVVGADGVVYASTCDASVAEIAEDGTFRLFGPKRGAPNGINLDRQGRLLIANFGIWTGEPGGLERFDPATGQHETLVASIAGRPLVASNYPIMDRRGNIWVSHSTSASRWYDALDGLGDGFIYLLRPDGSTSIVAEGLRFANGLAFSADERWLFCAQTAGGDVLRYPIVDGATLGAGERYGPTLGLIPDRATVSQPPTPEWRAQLGYTDGLGFDSEGNLWVTLPAANKVVAITPAGDVVTIAHDPAGELLREPTNVAWGGPGLRDLYVGSIGVDYVLRAESPVAGQPLFHQRSD